MVAISKHLCGAATGKTVTYVHTVCTCIQWNISNLDKESALVSEVSSFQRLKCMQEWYLGWEKVSCSMSNRYDSSMSA